jgi:putative spermidine/putrescine transport system ATP-binding protein
VSFLGAVVRIRVRLAENSIKIDTFNNPGLKLPERGRPVTVSFAKDDLIVLQQSAG